MAKNEEKTSVEPVPVEPVAAPVEVVPEVVVVTEPEVITESIPVEADITGATTEAGEPIPVQEIVEGDRIIIKPEVTVVLKGINTEKEIIESHLSNGFDNVFELVSATTESIIIKNKTDTPKQIMNGAVLLVVIVKV